MAASSLTLQISPPLLEALKMPAGGAVDYFQLLGSPRQSPADEGAIDRAVLERSKALRQWQNSPQYGQEVVKLLPQLHRAAKILKDPTRRRAYREELERAERGEEASAAEDFADLVRAAVADGRLDQASRQMLSEFAQQHGIDQAEARRAVEQAHAEMEARRAAEAPPAKMEAAAKGGDDEWEFRIGGEGEESYELMMEGLEASGKFTEDTPGRLIADASKYNISAMRAAEMLRTFQRKRFQMMVRRVAGGGIVRDNQVALLAGKSLAYGLDQREAYELISDYTLSAHSPEEMFEAYAAAETFSQSDIEHISEEKLEAPHARRRGFLAAALASEGARKALFAVAGAALLALVFFWLHNRGTGGGIDVAKAETPRPTPGAARTPQAPSPAQTQAQTHAERPGGTPAASATPLSPLTDTSPLVSVPDPASGMIAFPPLQSGDPPAFEMAIAEVTKAEYDAFLHATLTAGPPGWSVGAEEGDLPATGMSWSAARAYCTWMAAQHGWQSENTRLPTAAEFLRAARGRTTRGEPSDPGYWDKARLNQRDSPAPVKQTQWDKIFIAGGRGQMYDLLGNVAEWGWDEKNGEHALLGGDYTQKDPNFNPLQIRWMKPDPGSASVGIRVVHIPD